MPKKYTHIFFAVVFAFGCPYSIESDKLKMNKILKKIINKPLRNPKDDPWNFINDAVADLLEI